MGTKKDSEQELVNSGENVVPADDEGKGISRRKFTRNALVGSAVLLTLGNRAAWGDPLNVSISANLWASYVNGGQNINNASYSPEQKSDILQFESCLEDYNPGHGYDLEVDPHICYPKNN